MTTTPSAVSVVDVHKEYSTGNTAVPALRGVTLDVAAGSFVAIMGPSGSGKSTLLHCIGALDRPTRGDVYVGGTHLSAMSEEDVTVYRRRHIGVIFQFFNLLSDLSIEDNVAVPLLLDGVRADVVHERVDGALEMVGLRRHRGRFPGELSGGEMQRVAIARALAVEPTLILADEPTGNLDSANGDAVLKLLREICDGARRTVVLVTHDRAAAERCDRIVEMRDGRVVGDTMRIAARKGAASHPSTSASARVALKN